MNNAASPAVRIDKWLWAVRVFKSRNLAADACRGGHVDIAGQQVKPAREVHVGEVIVARVGQVTRTLKVLALLDKRVGAPLVKEYMEDLTPASEYQKPREEVFKPLFFRPKGSGRPTKKDRREMEKLF